jgi:hypothetical protein
MMAQRYANSALFCYETAMAMDPNATGRFMEDLKWLSIVTHRVPFRFVKTQFPEFVPGIGPFHAGRKNSIVAIEHAMNFAPGLGTEQQLQAALSILAEDSRNLINSIVAQMRQEDW